jgi:hypothetical protein
MSVIVGVVIASTAPAANRTVDRDAYRTADRDARVCLTWVVTRAVGRSKARRCCDNGLER